MFIHTINQEHYSLPELKQNLKTQVTMKTMKFIWRPMNNLFYDWELAERTHYEDPLHYFTQEELSKSGADLLDNNCEYIDPSTWISEDELREMCAKVVKEWH